MTLPEFCIRRPVFAIVLNLLVLLLGFIAYDRLSVREYPNADEPAVTVETFYRGASADIMETQVTKIMEDSLAGIEGIDFMSSISREQSSQITLRFKPGRDADAAAADTRDRVARVRGDLPNGVDEPIVAKVEADAQPIIYLAFASTRHTPLEITDFAERQVRDQLKTLPGVASVPIFGERRTAMRVWADADKLASYNLTVGEMLAAIRRQNIDIPAGRIESQWREFSVSGSTDLRTPEEFAQIIIKDDGKTLVRLGDVALIQKAAADERVVARFNGQPAVALGVVKQSTGNPLEIGSALRAQLPEIQKRLPDGMRIELAYDASLFIARSVAAVYGTILEAVGLVVLVIFFFLRTVRATFIPLITIPISLIGAFAIMALLGFSINTLTLLALVLAVGLVVDDAIVVLENIYRHIEEGMTPIDAALKGSREIVFAVIAMTITLAAVYTPMAFSEGRTGKLFAEFALTLAGAVVVSGFVALTLTPMMCSKLLRHTASPAWSQRIEDWLNHLASSYAQTLRAVLAAPKRVVAVIIVTAGIGAGFFTLLPQELSPVEDRSIAIGFMIAPEGSSIEYVDQYSRQIEAIYSNIPEQIRFFTISGAPQINQGISFLGLTPWENRNMPAQAIIGMLFGSFMSMPGVLAFPLSPPALGAELGKQPLEMVIQTTGTYEELDAQMQQIAAKLAQNPGITNPDIDLKMTKPELRFSIDRDKAALMGVDVAAIGEALQTLVGSSEVTRFRQDVFQYDVIVQLAPSARERPRDLTNIYVRSKDGQMVSLSNLVNVAEVATAGSLNHFNKLRAATISAGMAPGMAMGDALDFMEATAKEVIGEKALIDYTGQSREFRSASGALMMVFLLALVFIYLVLSAQYESFLDPLVIMLSVPLAVAGALFTLWLTAGSMNVYSQIGIITLVGLITKHGILIVEFANQARVKGKDAKEAVIEAASVRLRPILMTTGAMVLGALPLAYAAGAGAESRQQIGWCIVGGMTFGTLLTLYIVPSAYIWLTKRRRYVATA